MSDLHDFAERVLETAKQREQSGEDPRIKAALFLGPPMTWTYCPLSDKEPHVVREELAESTSDFVAFTWFDRSRPTAVELVSEAYSPSAGASALRKQAIQE